MEPLMLDYYVHGSFLPLLSPRIILEDDEDQRAGKKSCVRCTLQSRQLRISHGKVGKKEEGEKTNQEPGRLFLLIAK